MISNIVLAVFYICTMILFYLVIKSDRENMKMINILVQNDNILQNEINELKKEVEELKEKLNER